MQTGISHIYKDMPTWVVAALSLNSCNVRSQDALKMVGRTKTKLVVWRGPTKHHRNDLMVSTSHGGQLAPALKSSSVKGAGVLLSLIRYETNFNST